MANIWCRRCDGCQFLGVGVLTGNNFWCRSCDGYRVGDMTPLLKLAKSVGDVTCRSYDVGDMTRPPTVDLLGKELAPPHSSQVAYVGVDITHICYLA